MHTPVHMAKPANLFSNHYLSYFSFLVYKDGVYSILGRTSVDIIKSGGYKIRYESTRSAQNSKQTFKYLNVLPRKFTLWVGFSAQVFQNRYVSVKPTTPRKPGFRSMKKKKTKQNKKTWNMKLSCKQLSPTAVSCKADCTRLLRILPYLYRVTVMRCGLKHTFHAFSLVALAK